MESPLELIEKSFNSQYSNCVHEALDELPENFTITDPCISGHPIVFASTGFLRMLGHSKEEVIGKNGRMFQGPETNRRAVMEIREAIREERATEISILNYHKNGAPFWILFHMSPVFRGEDGRVMNFVGVQVPITRKVVGLRGGAGRHSVDLCRQGYGSCEFLLRSCRRELCCSKRALDSGSGLACDSVLDSRKEFEDLCEASELEKQKASNAVKNIISVLSRYSEVTGRPVSGKRCNMHGTSALSSALIISLGRIKQSFVLYDPHLQNWPIVYASDSFLTMTGYARHEVLGCSRKLLWGLETDPSTLELIDERFKGGQTCKARILYYRKDQSSFWSLLNISPVRNASGKIAYFVEVQIDEDWGILEYRELLGADPLADTLGFYNFIKKSLRVKVDRRQVVDKIRKMKRRYMSNLSNTKKNDQNAFALLKKIWGIDVEGAELDPQSILKTRRLSKAEDANVKKEVQDNDSEMNKEGISLQFVGQSSISMGLDENIVKVGLGLCGDVKKAEMEEKWKQFYLEESSLFLRKLDLAREESKMIREALKSDLGK